LVHVQDGRRLREIWQRASEDERAAALAVRPVLRRLDDEPDPDRLEGWIRLERLAWQCVNRERYGRYQQIWKEFYRRWRHEPDWAWPTNEPFAAQHRRLVAAARRHGLTPDPIAKSDRAHLFAAGLARAAAMGLTTLDLVRSVAPPLDEVLP
jgi:hypothetical protein